MNIAEFVLDERTKRYHTSLHLPQSRCTGMYYIGRYFHNREQISGPMTDFYLLPSSLFGTEGRIPISLFLICSDFRPVVAGHTDERLLRLDILLVMHRLSAETRHGFHWATERLLVMWFCDGAKTSKVNQLLLPWRRRTYIRRIFWFLWPLSVFLFNLLPFPYGETFWNM